jgi:hypothetical protein
MLKWHPRLIALVGTQALIAAVMAGAAEACGRSHGW